MEIEVVAWVTKFVGGDGSSRKVYHEAAQRRGYGADRAAPPQRAFPQLHKALWDPATGDLGEHIEVLVNDAVLDVTHTLDSPVRTGDASPSSDSIWGDERKKVQCLFLSAREQGNRRWSPS